MCSMRRVDLAHGHFFVPLSAKPFHIKPWLNFHPKPIWFPLACVVQVFKTVQVHTSGYYSFLSSLYSGFYCPKHWMRISWPPVLKFHWIRFKYVRTIIIPLFKWGSGVMQWLHCWQMPWRNITLRTAHSNWVLSVTKAIINNHLSNT